MKPNVGYLLPSGDAFEEDLQCMMLFYPDRAEYRQALFGSLDYLATWIAWERDDEKRGIDAGRSWALAVALTRECMEMNTCETILALLTEIRDNTGVHCCDVVDISGGDRYTDEVEDGVGNVPQNVIDAGYAEDAADWDGFDDYKCMISHLMVQNLQSSTAIILSRMDGTEAALITVTALAAIALAIATAGGAILVYGIMLSVAGVAGLYAAVTLLGAVGLSSLVDNLEDHYDDLVCAIYNADGSLDAVDALKAAIDEHFNIAEAAYLKNLNLGPQLKALYSARYDQQDIAEIMADKGYDTGDFTCDCEIPTTPTILDIMAVCWTFDMTGDALTDGLGSGDPTNMRVGAPFPVGQFYDIIHHNQYHGPPDGGNGIKHTFHASDAPAGYDSESPGALTSVPTLEWREVEKDFWSWAYSNGTTTASFTLRNLRVFVDTGSGYEWLDGSWTFSEKNTSRWTYSVPEQWQKYTVVAASPDDEALQFRIYAEVPD